MVGRYPRIHWVSNYRASFIVTQIHNSAEIDPSVQLGGGTSVWQHAHIREGATVGENCTIGRGAYVGAGVTIGSSSKIQNYALIYEPAQLGVGVFVGPGAVLTNDQYPRAVKPDLSEKTSSDWAPVGVSVAEGASIGARAVCVAPVRVGRWSLVAAGSVVIRDVLDFELVGGNPAKNLGWVGRAGKPLARSNSGWQCPETGVRYEGGASGLVEISSEGQSD
jgi:UDP-2-acetamido-3-amino-2,3-dideoxy-glucuronate N-acetyltransferase